LPEEFIGAMRISDDLTPTASTTRIEKLVLRNYRRFEHLEIEFDRRLTVIVAPNGAGETAILDATATGLRLFVDTMRGAGASAGFSVPDVRMARIGPEMVPLTPTRLDAEARIDDRATTWARALSAPHGKTTIVDAKALRDRAKGLQRDLEDYASGRRRERPELPVIAYYGTGRLYRQLKTTESKRLASENLAISTGAYLDCLDPDSSFGHFTTWFERVSREAQSERVSARPSPYRPTQLLAAVKGAVDELLKPTGWAELDWSFVASEITMRHTDEGEMPLSWLSDGVRNVVSLVADLAHRCARLNPTFGAEAAKKSPGIVLVDEIDMHLHPAWQQTILSSLQAAFPRVQFIVTTHSPQLVSTATVDSVRILAADGSVSRPDIQTRGLQSASILAEVMDVSPVPDVPEAKALSRYRLLIQSGQGEGDEARGLRANLDAHFGPAHPLMLECDRLLRLQRMKVKWTPSGDV
jgi:predicted ATP-binding protein involved in virulence